MHRPETKIEREVKIFMQQTQPTNQVHENQCIELKGEYVKPFCACR
jgi:hypothetical protein